MKIRLMFCRLGYFLGPSFKVGLVKLYLASHGFDLRIGLGFGAGLVELDLASHGFGRELIFYLSLVCLGLSSVYRCNGRIPNLHGLHPGRFYGGPCLGDDLRIRGLQRDVQLLL